MALKVVLLALLVCCAASEAQSQGDSLPLSYNVNELQGDGATCPNDQLRQETRDNITTNIRTQLQDTVVPILGSQSLPQCPCMSTGRRVAYLDMTDPSHQCPAGWVTYTNPTRACGRGFVASACSSLFYPTNGISYSRVCGRIIAYQYCYTTAFYRYNLDQTRTIDDVYLDGVSITHGNSSREHVWSFASAYYESYTGTADQTCPCTNTNNNNNANILIPPFVGDNYFCDSGVSTFPAGSCTHFFSDDPLWDGDGCGSTSTCCEFNNPPWFCKTLPQPTTDDIEVRICGTGGSRDTPVELIELFVA